MNALTKALDAILELHKPARYISIEQGCSVCRHYEPGMAGGPQPIPYPCPTVKVILGLREE